MLRIKHADNFRRTAAGLCLIGGPLLVLIGGLVTPWEEKDTLPSYLTALADNPSRAQASAVLLYLGFLLFVPGIFGMIHLVRTRAVVLGHAAGVLAIWGWVTLPGLLVTDFQDLSMAESLDISQAAAISERAQGYVGALFLTLPPLLGMIGLTLLLVALWRANAAPAWAPTAFLVGFSLEFVLPGAVPAVLGFTLTAALWLAALGRVGLGMLRMSDKQWRHGLSPLPMPAAGEAPQPAR